MLIVSCCLLISCIIVVSQVLGLNLDYAIHSERIEVLIRFNRDFGGGGGGGGGGGDGGGGGGGGGDGGGPWTLLY